MRNVLAGVRPWVARISTRAGLLLAIAAVTVAVAIGSAGSGWPGSSGIGPRPSGTTTPDGSRAPNTSPGEGGATAWAGTGRMATARDSHTATLLANGSVLVAGGENASSTALASAEVYDPRSGTWTATGDMIHARAFHTATLLRDGRVLVAGGTGRGPGVAGGNGSGPGALASAEVYDPRSGTWTDTGDMIDPRSSQTATLLPNGKVLVAGGYQGSNFFTPGVHVSAEVYDPSSGSWTAAGAMVERRAAHTATLLPNGTVLVTGGFNGNQYLASAEVYDPDGGSWSGTSTMRWARASHTATLLADGSVLVAGGIGSSLLDVLSSVELFDPGSGSWTVVGPMDSARAFGVAVLLRDDLMLLTGGSDSLGSPLASAELYYPISVWSAATSTMDQPRTRASATLLSDDEVLVAGGSGGGLRASALASAALYDPSLDPTARCELSPGAAPAATILIQDKKFGPEVTVRSGEAVAFTNIDGTAHTVTEGVDGHVADHVCARQRLAAHAGTVVTFHTSGDYAFTCTIHPSMQVAVHVR